MATRRDFLRTLGAAGAAAGSGSILGCSLGAGPAVAGPGPVPAIAGTPSWAELRAMFRLRPDRVHLSGFLLASHPAPVRQAIDALREELDADPPAALRDHDTEGGIEDRVRQAVVAYTGGAPDDVALTDSTTMGLGLLYGGLRLAPGDEVLATEHEHYSSNEPLRLAAARTGAAVRRVPLYTEGRDADPAAMVAAIAGAIAPRTRIVHVTWVHSSTGVKLPIRAIAGAVAAANARRPEAEHALLCVDGVHGFGCAPERVADLGCDAFVAGCHKWLFGPRGTGIVWATPAGWRRIAPLFAAFERPSYEAYMKDQPGVGVPPARLATPGGFHSFEHRWALPAAFALHAAIGRERAAARVSALASQLKEGLAAMRHVALHTPLAPDRSAGIVTFDVAGLEPKAVVARLAERSIVASATPYRVSYARLAPALWNTPEEIDLALAAVRALA